MVNPTFSVRDVDAPVTATLLHDIDSIERYINGNLNETISDANSQAAQDKGFTVSAKQFTYQAPASDLSVNNAAELHYLFKDSHGAIIGKLEVSDENLLVSITPVSNDFSENDNDVVFAGAKLTIEDDNLTLALLQQMLTVEVKNFDANGNQLLSGEAQQYYYKANSRNIKDIDASGIELEDLQLGVNDDAFKNSFITSLPDPSGNTYTISIPTSLPNDADHAYDQLEPGEKVEFKLSFSSIDGEGNPGELIREYTYTINGTEDEPSLDPSSNIPGTTITDVSANTDMSGATANVSPTNIVIEYTDPDQVEDQLKYYLGNVNDWVSNPTAENHTVNIIVTQDQANNLANLSEGENLGSVSVGRGQRDDNGKWDFTVEFTPNNDNVNKMMNNETLTADVYLHIFDSSEHGSRASVPDEGTSHYSRIKFTGQIVGSDDSPATVSSQSLTVNADRLTENISGLFNLFGENDLSGVTITPTSDDRNGTLSYSPENDQFTYTIGADDFAALTDEEDKDFTVTVADNNNSEASVDITVTLNGADEPLTIATLPAHESQVPRLIDSHEINDTAGEDTFNDLTFLLSLDDHGEDDITGVKVSIDAGAQVSLSETGHEGDFGKFFIIDACGNKVDEDDIKNDGANAHRVLYEPNDDKINGNTGTSTDQCIFTFSEGDRKARAQITITVKGVDDPLSVVLSDSIIQEGTDSLEQSITATLSDRDAPSQIDISDVSVTTDSNNTTGANATLSDISISGQSVSFKFKVASGLDALDAGDRNKYTLTFTTSSHGSVTHDITITGTNDTPVFTALSPIGLSEQDTSGDSGNIIATDADASGQLVYLLSDFDSEDSGVRQRTLNGILLQLNKNTGDFDYAMTSVEKDMAGDASQNVVFPYTISDGSANVTGNITINKFGINDKPTLGTISQISIIENGTNFTITLSGNDPDGDSLTYGLTFTDISGFISRVSDSTLPANKFKYSVTGDSLYKDEVKTFTGVASVEDDEFTVTQDVTIEMTGFNDAAVITATTPNIQTTENPTAASDNNVAVSDVDGDNLSYSVNITAGPTWNLATSGTGILSEAIKTKLKSSVSVAAQTGSGYKLTVAKKDYDFLESGETITMTATVTVRETTPVADLSHNTQTKTHAITITGVNDDLVISSVSTPNDASNNEAVGSGNTNISYSGTLKIQDPDLNEKIKITVDSSGVNVDYSDTSGVDLDIDASNLVFTFPSEYWKASGDAYILDLSENHTHDASMNVIEAARTINWSFSKSNLDLNAMAEGDKIIVTYNFTVHGTDSDSQSRTLTFTITGTNDVPSITSDAASAAATEAKDNNTTLTLAREEVTVTDLDHDSTFTINIDPTNATVVWAPAVSGVSLDTYLDEDEQRVLKRGLEVCDASGNKDDSGSYIQYNETADLNFLRKDETLTITIPYTVTDDKNAESESKNFQLTVTGTNDNHKVVTYSTTVADTLDGLAQDQIEPSGNFTHTFTITDVDINDRYTSAVLDLSNVTWVYADGTTDTGKTFDTTNVDTTVTSVFPANNVEVTITIPYTDMDKIGKDETVTLNYELTVKDDSDVSNNAAHYDNLEVIQFSVTLTGSNETPVIKLVDSSGNDLSGNNVSKGEDDTDFYNKIVLVHYMRVSDKDWTDSAITNAELREIKYTDLLGNEIIDDAIDHIVGLGILDNSGNNLTNIDRALLEGAVELRYTYADIAGYRSSLDHSMVTDPYGSWGSGLAVLPGEGDSHDGQEKPLFYKLIVDSNKVQFLAAGESLTYKYRVYVRDDSYPRYRYSAGEGENMVNQTSQDIEFTITGTNDLADIAVSETNLRGFIYDKDLTDTLTVSAVIKSVTATRKHLNNDPVAVVDAVDTLSLTAEQLNLLGRALVFTGASSPGNPGLPGRGDAGNNYSNRIVWEYDRSLIDFMEENDRIDMTFTVMVSDGHTQRNLDIDIQLLGNDSGLDGPPSAYEHRVFKKETAMDDPINLLTSVLSAEELASGDYSIDSSSVSVSGATDDFDSSSNNLKLTMDTLTEDAIVIVDYEIYNPDIRPSTIPVKMFVHVEDVNTPPTANALIQESTNDASNSLVEANFAAANWTDADGSDNAITFSIIDVRSYIVGTNEHYNLPFGALKYVGGATPSGVTLDPKKLTSLALEENLIILVTYKATDEGLASTEATITFTVTGTDHPAVAPPVTKSIRASDGTYYGKLEATDVDSTVTYVAKTDTSSSLGDFVLLSNGNWSFTPASGIARGTHTFSTHYDLSGDNTDVSSNVNLSIIVENNVPYVVDSLTTKNISLDDSSNTSVSIAELFDDKDKDVSGHALTYYAVGALPKGVTLNANTGNLSVDGSQYADELVGRVTEILNLSLFARDDRGEESGLKDVKIVITGTRNNLTLKHAIPDVAKEGESYYAKFEFAETGGYPQTVRVNDASNNDKISDLGLTYDPSNGILNGILPYNTDRSYTIKVEEVASDEYNAFSLPVSLSIENADLSVKNQIHAADLTKIGTQGDSDSINLDNYVTGRSTWKNSEGQQDPPSYRIVMHPDTTISGKLIDFTYPTSGENDGDKPNAINEIRYRVIPLDASGSGITEYQSSWHTITLVGQAELTATAPTAADLAVYYNLSSLIKSGAAGGSILTETFTLPGYVAHGTPSYTLNGLSSGSKVTLRDSDGNRIDVKVGHNNGFISLSVTERDIHFSKRITGPNNSFTGSFTYTVTDSTDSTATDTATVSLNVYYDGTTAGNLTVNVIENVPKTIRLPGKSQFSDNLSWSLDASGTLSTAALRDKDITVEQLDGNLIEITAGDAVKTEKNVLGLRYTVTNTVTLEVVTGTLTIDVTAVNDAPIITPLSLSSTKLEADVFSLKALLNNAVSGGSITITDVDSSANSGEWVILSPPVHGKYLTNGDFELDEDYNGKDSFTFAWRDGHGAMSEVGTVHLTINDVNDAPVVEYYNPLNYVEDSGTYEFRLSASDVDGPHKNWTLTGTDVSGVTLSTAGVLTIDTTDANFEKADGVIKTVSFEVQVSDEAPGDPQTGSQTITINVAGKNDAPVVSAVTMDISENDTAATLTLTATDVDTSKNDLSWTLLSINEGGKIRPDLRQHMDITAAGQFIVESSLSTVSDVNSMDSNDSLVLSVKFRVSDGDKFAEDDITLRINGENDFVITQDRDINLTQGSELFTFVISDLIPNVVTEDPDADGDAAQLDFTGILTLVDKTPPFTHSRSWDPSGGALTITPNQSLAEGQTEHFQLVVPYTDGSPPAVFNFFIHGSNDAPTVNAVPQTTINDVSASDVKRYNLISEASGNDIDDGSTLSVVLTNVETHDYLQGEQTSVVTSRKFSDFYAMAIDSSTQQLVLTPTGLNAEILAEGESVSVEVKFKVSDEHGALSPETTKTITIQGTNQAPTITEATIIGTTESENSVTVELANIGTDVDENDSLSIALVSDPVSIEDRPGHLGPTTATANADGNKITLVYDASYVAQMAEGESLTARVTYKITDSVAFSVDTKYVDITINGANAEMSVQGGNKVETLNDDATTMNTTLIFKDDDKKDIADITDVNVRLEHLSGEFGESISDLDALSGKLGATVLGDISGVLPTTREVRLTYNKLDTDFNYLQEGEEFRFRAYVTLDDVDMAYVDYKIMGTDQEAELRNTFVSYMDIDGVQLYDLRQLVASDVDNTEWDFRISETQNDVSGSLSRVGNNLRVDLSYYEYLKTDKSRTVEVYIEARGKGVSSDTWSTAGKLTITINGTNQRPVSQIIYHNGSLTEDNSGTRFDLRRANDPESDDLEVVFKSFVVERFNDGENMGHYPLSPGVIKADSTSSSEAIIVNPRMQTDIDELSYLDQLKIKVTYAWRETDTSDNFVSGDNVLEITLEGVNDDMKLTSANSFSVNEDRSIEHPLVFSDVDRTFDPTTVQVELLDPSNNLESTYGVTLVDNSGGNYAIRVDATKDHWQYLNLSRSGRSGEPYTKNLEMTIRFSDADARALDQHVDATLTLTVLGVNDFIMSSNSNVVEYEGLLSTTTLTPEYGIVDVDESHSKSYSLVSVSNNMGGVGEFSVDASSGQVTWNAKKDDYKSLRQGTHRTIVLTIEVTDLNAHGEEMETKQHLFTVTVVGTNNRPVANLTTLIYEYPETASDVTIDLTLQDHDVGDTHTYQLTTINGKWTNHHTFDPSNGVLTLNPAGVYSRQQLRQDHIESYTFGYTVTDNSDTENPRPGDESNVSAEKQFTVRIKGMNQDPTIAGIFLGVTKVTAASVLENDSITLTLSASDGDVIPREDDLTWSVESVNIVGRSSNITKLGADATPVFGISGNQLVVTPLQITENAPLGVFNYLTQGQKEIVEVGLEVEDEFGGSANTTVRITIMGVTTIVPGVSVLVDAVNVGAVSHPILSGTEGLSLDLTKTPPVLTVRDFSLSSLESFLDTSDKWSRNLMEGSVPGTPGILPVGDSLLRALGSETVGGNTIEVTINGEVTGGYVPYSLLIDNISDPTNPSLTFNPKMYQHLAGPREGNPAQVADIEIPLKAVIKDGSGNEIFEINMPLPIKVTGTNQDATISGSWLTSGILGSNTDGTLYEPYEPHILNYVIGGYNVFDVDASENRLQDSDIRTHTGKYGDLSVDRAGAFTYEVDVARSQLLAVGTEKEDRFTLTSYDGTAAYSVVVTVIGTNDAPRAMRVDVTSATGEPLTGELVAEEDDIVDKRDSLSYTISKPDSSLPEGLTLDTPLKTGLRQGWSFNPLSWNNYLSEGQSRVVVYNWVVTDEHDASSESSFSIQVSKDLESNMSAKVITTSKNPEKLTKKIPCAKVFDSYELNLDDYFNDPEGTKLSYAIKNNSDSAWTQTMKIDGSGNNMLTAEAPRVEAHGEMHSVTIQATDATELKSQEKEFSICVGDPYIYPIKSDIPVKLPDEEASYRLYENNTTFINAEVAEATSEHSGRMIKFVEDLGHDSKNVISDGFFFNKFYIADGNNKMMVDLIEKEFKLVKGSDRSFFKLSQNNDFAGSNDWNGAAKNVVVEWTTAEGVEMEATVHFFKNPHIENGISLKVKNMPEEAVGLCVSNYRPSLMRIPSVNTLAHKSLKTKLRKSRNPFLSKPIKEHNERWIMRQSLINKKM